MEKKVHSIMLVDDNADDNYFHKRVILKSAAADVVLVMQSGEEALEYLIANQQGDSKNLPNLIFLDINMPGMNGWEFIEQYKKLDTTLQSNIFIVMLTTSANPDHSTLAKSEVALADFRTKPLSKEMLDEILTRYLSR
jgi:CheY-like chemotaxis protein